MIKATQIDGDVAIGHNVTAGGSATIRGDVKVGHDVTIEGWLNARNIRGAGKGLYATEERLNEAYPKPHNGWWALVGDTLPAKVYRAWGGEWVATGETGGDFTMEWDKLEEVAKLLDEETSEREAADEEMKSGLADETAARKAADEAEAAARTAAISEAVGAEAAERKAADEEIKVSVAGEAATRKAADEAEATARAAADEEIKTGLAAEATARAKAVADEAAERKAADGAEATARTEAVEAEAAARKAADEAEAEARTEGDKILKTAITAEEATRKSADEDQKARLLALEGSVWPLEARLKATPQLAEHTGGSVAVTVAWDVERKGTAEDPTRLTLTMDGVEVAVAAAASGEVAVPVATLGETVFGLAVEADGLTATAEARVTQVLPIYMGFAVVAAVGELDMTALGKCSPRKTVAGTYTLRNGTDGSYLWVCVPEGMTLSKVTSSGFTVPMEAAEEGSTALGGYKCHRSSNAIVAGEYTYVAG